VIELLVVIAIAALLVSLSLAAVQRARASSDRVKCCNNLRQLGIALHHYHDSYLRLPPGCSVQNGKDPQPFMSWCTRLLPFLEQEVLWQEAVRAYKQDPAFLRNPPHVGLTRVLPVFGCPADDRTLTPRDPHPAFTAYLGVEGIDQSSHDGVLYLDSRVRLADITDGTSCTLMVGERPPDKYGALGWRYAGWGQSKDGSAEMVLGVRELNAFSSGVGPGLRLCPAGPYEFGPGQVNNACDVLHFWSLHSGGAHFLFADGSVHFLSYEANSILPALATRAGREAVEVP
jgi:prepilin-type processing-associated H-X9-DG protein